MEKDYQLLFLEIKKYFRETVQTSWGKYQILDKLDELEEEFLKESQKKEVRRLKFRDRKVFEAFINHEHGVYESIPGGYKCSICGKEFITLIEAEVSFEGG